MSAEVIFLEPFEPDPWSDSEIRVACEVLGIDVESHRCDCEVCSRTSAFCTATRSSLILEIQASKNK